MVAQFVWQVEETAGFESSWVTLDDLVLHAEGRAVGQLPEPYWLSYTLDTDDQAATTCLTITAATPTTQHHLDLRRVGDDWTVNGEPRPDLAGALDCDIACSPLTNTMPIIRTALHRKPGSIEFLMAFVEVPTLRVIPDRQTYTHLDTNGDGGRVRYASGSFTSDLTIDSAGFVVVYPTMARRLPPEHAATQDIRQQGPGSARPD
ncbi:putative glycolipid-binding domain-containing protein [Nocardia sp. NPDC052566]|uniref:putative glycolipid-binding domain-containing protein n=1 Tax=Nocardia sp. NPDC052566 TaxID=3364330 RepID=UPI0037CB95B7